MTEATGQGVHEREISRQLLADATLEGFYVGQAAKDGSTALTHERATFIPIKKNAVGFLAYQARLFRHLWRLSNRDSVIFVRYAPAIIAPALVSIVRRVPVVVRTGPVLRNLAIYEKKVSPMGRLAIYAFSWLHYKAAKRIVVVTDTIRAYLCKTFRLPENKFVISPNGCNPEIFKPLDDVTPIDVTRGLDQAPLVVFVGSFFSDTGVQDLVAALILILMRQPNSLNGVLVGDGPLRAELVKTVEEAGLGSRIRFPGRKSQADINVVLNQAGLAVVPFRRLSLEETGSAALKIYEYLATGVPVLATEHRDHQFLVLEGLGHLCVSDDPDAMAAAIVQSLGEGTSDAKRRARRQFVLRDGTWEAAYRRLRQVCRDASPTAMAR